MLCWVISLFIWYFHNPLDKHCKLWFPRNEPLYVQEQASKKSQLSLGKSVLEWPSPTCRDVWVPAPTLGSPSLPKDRLRIDPSQLYFPPANSASLCFQPGLWEPQGFRFSSCQGLWNKSGLFYSTGVLSSIHLLRKWDNFCHPCSPGTRAPSSFLLFAMGVNFLLPPCAAQVIPQQIKLNTLLLHLRTQITSVILEKIRDRVIPAADTFCWMWIQTKRVSHSLFGCKSFGYL